MTWIPLLQGWAPGWLPRSKVTPPRMARTWRSEQYRLAGYWQTMGVRIFEGRDFDEGDRFDPDLTRESAHGCDRQSTLCRAVLRHTECNRQALRRRGTRRRIGHPNRRRREDSLYAGPSAGLQPSAFFSFSQANFPVEATFYVRTRTESLALFLSCARSSPGSTHRIPIYGMKTLERQLDDTLSSERLIASLSLVFAVLATMMAALGLYGVMSFVVARRTREIGLRIALGAASSSVVRMVMGEIAILAGSGLLVGLPCAYGLSRLVSSQLVDMPSADGITTGAAALILVVVAAISASCRLAARARSSRSGRSVTSSGDDAVVHQQIRHHRVASVKSGPDRRAPPVDGLVAVHAWGRLHDGRAFIAPRSRGSGNVGQTCFCLASAICARWTCSSRKLPFDLRYRPMRPNVSLIGFVVTSACCTANGRPRRAGE